MQEALREHARDVLWEAPGSRVGAHALALATAAVRDVCEPSRAVAAAPLAAASTPEADGAARANSLRLRQISFASAP